jgi:ABC-type transporter Mla MlaB component
VDSAAISLMLEWVRRFRTQGRQIAFANLGGNLASLAELYGVGDLVPRAE